MARTRDQAPSQRATVKQTAARADYEAATLYKIIDEALVGTVSIAVDGQPFALPMMIARIDEHIYLHGSRTSRIIKHLTAGHEVCIAFTLIDGIVVARSGMNCSANYRSAVVHGRGEAVDGAEKAELLHQITYALIPGSKDDYREHLPEELKATSLIRITLNEAACKVRIGGPKDDKDDVHLPYWAGVIPLTHVYGEPIPATDLPAGIETPEYALKFPLRD
ncbi:pyridoxamine 5'-phosphate oxidase family protein [uncultured Thiothrix sp.]|uniref:pyridoxamine 5'-phosphate oxidase family protein n=1 Tax=uncultured Thiothrix sp. TaxID=223185 RepID=UPI00260D9B46|nr:pyridoxamine 5'-phosphate oxidase family protein [uncultured Thiothrix sp.]HMT92520.1 pyridoxamine 5'-phosphate oxidase family protein [Thiolinea sp.]